ncbi:hypothetical protein HWV62_40876 [Athelia sp. TMB]|nr:hypothetical protein HWV62_40876 [Athelia sp. TMB]
MPWFDDGTMILHAQSTRFKVCLELLAQKSAFFADKLALLEPGPSGITNDNRFVQGCPVVHLPDKAEDWGYMLDALINRKTPLPFAIACSPLRLACVYEFVDLLEEIMERLTHTFPSTIEV